MTPRRARAMGSDWKRLNDQRHRLALVTTEKFSAERGGVSL